MKRTFKILGLIVALALSATLLFSCKGKNDAKVPEYDASVVKAFNAITPTGDLVSQTAAKKSKGNYLVTVITSETVSEYSVNSSFEVENSNAIVSAPSAAGIALLAAGEEAGSVIEQLYAKALELSEVNEADIAGFDFDKDTYRGKSVYKVEIEDAVAEYTYIFDAATLELVTSEIELKNTAPAGSSSYIGEAKAKAIALDAAGISAVNAANFTIKSMMSDGRRIYKVRFDNAGYRYDVDVDAVSGDIVKYSKSVLDGNVKAPEIDGIISEEEAKQIALAFAFPEGVPQGVQMRKVKLDYEDGMFVYEVEFGYARNEYEFEIIASDGRIADAEIDEDDDYDFDYDDDRLPQSGEFITREQAVAKVREQAPDAFILEVETEKEFVGGQFVYYYEIEAKVGNREIEYRVDAVTGEVTVKGEREPMGGVTITQEQALAIALDVYNFTESQVRDIKIELDYEDGILVYEVEYKNRSMEYSVEIDAATGKVLRYEREYD